VDTLRADKRFGVTALEPAADAGGLVYSSTRIRAALREGDLAAAAALLGYPFEMEGEVLHGDKRGREIGFPTANQDVTRYVRLPFGIYAVRVLIEGEENWRSGAASFGLRPMFEVTQPLLETTIFDFQNEIYGKKMRVRPIKYLRPEMNFGHISELTAQIRKDCAHAREALLKENS
jgi:riboflavin kinase/FMN adenylyltransferase